MKPDQPIQRLFTLLYSSRLMKWIMPVLLCIYLICCYHRFIYIDDAFFGEEVYSLATLGKVCVPSFIDFNGGAEQLMVYHKLLIYSGALLVNIFGWSIEPLRMATLLLFMILCWAIYRHVRKQMEQPEVAFPALFLFLLSPLLLLYSYTFRPEIWVACFGFLSYSFLSSHIYFRNRTGQLFFSGGLAGIAFLVHPNGIVFILAGLLLLLYHRYWRGILLFGVSAASVSVFFFHDLWQPGRWELMLYQMHHWPDNVATNYNSGSVWQLIWNVFRKLGQEHQRFFWSYKVWASSVMFVAALLLMFRKFYRDYRDLFLYTISLIVLLNLLGSQIAERYLIIHLPFLVILTALAIRDGRAQKSQLFSAVMILAMVAQLVGVSVMASSLMRKNMNYTEAHRDIMKLIPEKGTLTLVPHQFIFPAITTHRLYSFKGIEYIETWNKRKYSQPELYATFRTLGVDYVVIPGPALISEYTAVPGLDKDVPLELQGSGYEIRHSDDLATILQRVNP